MAEPSRILLVDDSTKVRFVTARILRGAGFHVAEAATGGDALRLAAEEHLDLIILDIQLPDVDGFEVCRRLKSDPATAGIAVLHLSGVYRGVNDRVRGLEIGADGFLTKPFEAAELVATVRALLRLRRIEAELHRSEVRRRAAEEMIAEDEAERRRLEERLRQAQKMEAIGRLAGGVAHDFNNLLMVILGRSDVLKELIGADDPRYRHVDLIQKTAEEAASLTGQLLAFSRQQVLNPKVLNLNAVLGGMKTMLRRLLGEDIHLVTVPGESLGRVKADPGQLQQVLLNLAVNARDAMPHGGRLTLETANVELDEPAVRGQAGARPGAYVRLTVSDAGMGMDAATQARIFEPFFTTKAPGQGTGLGLSTVWGIVKQSGGYVSVESAPGRGATFTIDLPRVEAPVEPAEPSPMPVRSPHGIETVLLVEDEDQVRDFTREILEGHGYTVLEAAHPGEALRLVADHAGSIHLLLTDVVMPGMSGRHLADRLTALRPELKVLYMSGYTEDGIVHHGVIAAGRAFLQKPFRGDVLAREVRRVLDTAPHALSTADSGR